MGKATAWPESKRNSIHLSSFYPRGLAFSYGRSRHEVRCPPRLNGYGGKLDRDWKGFECASYVEIFFFSSVALGLNSGEDVRGYI